MELREVKQRITQIKNVAEQAIEACRADIHVPRPLKISITAFDAELSNAVQTVKQAKDEAEVEQCIDYLEEAADQVKQEAQRTSGISEQTRIKVLRAHNEISQLKHQLH
jgi:hypothetical protein